MTNGERVDVNIVGGGPAGLAAAIHFESEGVNAAVREAANRLGGQAGTTSLVKNYPGIPAISGEDLTTRFVQQARGFGTNFDPCTVTGISRTDQGFVLHDSGTPALESPAVLLANGVQYRALTLPGLEGFLNGRGAKYGSPELRERYENKTVVVVGGANSAGQAAVHLSKFPGCHVLLLIRGSNIEDKMSTYLVNDVAHCSNVTVLTNAELAEVGGNDRLQDIVITTPNGPIMQRADELFIMIGAEPKTQWLPSEIALDSLGYVLTGRDLPPAVLTAFVGRTGRQPFAHETSMEGVFAAGDVRHGTTKRIVAAVGDGGSAVPEIHQYLASLNRERSK